MKIPKFFILMIAALGGYAVFKARLHTMEEETESGNTSSGFYANVAGQGSLGQTFKDANEDRKQGIATDTGDTSKGVLTTNHPQARTGNSVGASPPVKEHIVQDAPLLAAAAKGDVKKVEDRLAQQARVDSRDGMRRTPLMYASGNGYQNICERLLAAGANPELRDRDEHNAYDYAAGHGRVDIVKYLLEETHSTDSNHYVEYAMLMQTVYSNDPRLLPEGSGKFSSVNRINPDGQAPLLMAAGNGAIAIMEALINRGADVNLVNNNRQTALLWAAWNNQTAAAEMLLKHGADSSIADIGGNTPLVMAVQNGSITAAKVLLQHGADPHIANKQGKNAVIIAEDKGIKELAPLFK